jgi:carbamate kinase
MLAREIDADEFIVATDADAVYLDWGTDEQRAVRRATPDSITSHAFAAGSMGPKVAAACDFVNDTGRTARIGDLSDLPAVLAGTAGTVIVPGSGVMELRQ